MNELLQALSHFFSSWKFWVIVAPWEIGVRIRLGHVSKNLAPGPHLRIPFLDMVTIINTRLRIASTPPITIQAAGGKVRTISATVGFRIADPTRAMLRYSHPETAVLSLAQAEIVAGAGAASDLVHGRLGKAFGENGIEIEFVRYVEDVEVRALRLLQNSWGFSHPGDATSVGGVAAY